MSKQRMSSLRSAGKAEKAKKCVKPMKAKPMKAKPMKAKPMKAKCAKLMKVKKLIKKSPAFINPNKCFLNNENKAYINATFAVMIMSLIHRIKDFTFDNCFIGAFDGVERKTANSLISMGFQQSAILLNEMNTEVANSHLKAGFCVHEGTDFGDSSFDKLYSEEGQAWRKYDCLGWYFDTCGEIHTQKPSLLSTIRKLNLINGSVLGFTFCRSRTTVEDYAKQKKLFIKDVNKILAARKMELRVDSDHDYSGSFMFKRSRESHMNSFMCSVVSKK